MNMSNEQLFFLNGTRAMVSLGPLTDVQHCPYRCAFCYVQDGFTKYARLDEDAIINFLHEQRDNYKIIYISGDTDSFAPPRTERALLLLERIVNELDVDVLFTTRTIFSSQHLEILKRIIAEQKRTGNMFYACISITRYSEEAAYIEPNPIPTPDERIETLINLKKIGATTVAALRPFLPIVDVNDYITILEKTKGYVDIALGEPFYFVRNGKICKRVFPNGIPEKIENDITRNVKMSFDNNNLDWDVWDSSFYENTVRKYCDDNNIVFSMHSDDAISKYLKKMNSAI